MYIERHIPNRQSNEKLVLFLRRHWLTIFGHWLFYLFLGTIPIGIYFFLKYQFPEILIGQFSYPFLLLLTSIYYLFLLLFFFNAFLDYNLDVWIVTNQRIINIEQKGLFNREIAEHSLERIQDVTGIQKGVWQTFFSYGDVHVQTAGEVQRFIFHKVNNPFEVVRILNTLIHKEEAKFEDKLADKLNGNS
jgi:uncharacterized membrane protein YdbT with pleckstrin-like domain